MQIDKVNTKIILNDYTYVLDKIYNDYQYKDILVNTDRFSFIERLTNDFNKHKLKKFVIGKEYIFGQPISNYLDRYFKVVFLGYIFIPIKKMNNNYIGICYVFSNDMIKKGIENLSHKSFFRLIINSSLSQFHKI